MSVILIVESRKELNVCDCFLELRVQFAEATADLIGGICCCLLSPAEVLVKASKCVGLSTQPDACVRPADSCKPASRGRCWPVFISLESARGGGVTIKSNK